MRTLASRCLWIVAPRAAVGALAAIALIGMSAADPASAQSPQTAGPISLGDLFGGDSPTLKPDKAKELVDAARKAKAPGKCPLGAIFIFTPEGDPLFQQSMAGARRQSVLQTLQRNGVDASRFFVDSLVSGTKNDATLHLQLDRAKPKLTTTSVPPKGNKVKAGGLIKVTMVVLTAKSSADVLVVEAAENGPPDDASVMLDWPFRRGVLG